MDITLDPIQARAIETAATHPVSIITGGPGTGKTTVLKALLRRVKAAEDTTALCSPTGKAARRMTEQTGWGAQTVHRLLGYDPRAGWTFTAQNPLPHDLVVVDEASMVDVELGASLLSAIRPGARLVLVGDADQLPPVGPGAVLGDLIESGRVPCVALERIYRQDPRSLISHNARRIRDGKLPEDRADAIDWWQMPAATQEACAATVEQLVGQVIPERHGIRPREVQVLSPQRNGLAGVEALNDRLQRVLNPAAAEVAEVKIGKLVLRAGDRVMQTKNNYDLGVMNGETGIVWGVTGDGRALDIDLEDRRVRYTRQQAAGLALAYASTVHKAQGSEYPVVVCVVHSGHTYMLTRRLLYTGVTRGKQAVYLVGDKLGLQRGVRNKSEKPRHTTLTERMAEV